MEGCLVATVRSLRQLGAERVLQVLQAESSRMEITKSILNILFNICFTKAVVLTQKQKKLFKAYDQQCIQLLSNEYNLAEKKQMLIRAPDLIQLIAQTCPPPSPDE